MAKLMTDNVTVLLLFKTKQPFDESAAFKEPEGLK